MAQSLEPETPLDFQGPQQYHPTQSFPNRTTEDSLTRWPETPRISSEGSNKSKQYPEYSKEQSKTESDYFSPENQSLKSNSLNDPKTPRYDVELSNHDVSSLISNSVHKDAIKLQVSFHVATLNLLKDIKPEILLIK